jgi:hypothetical protein
MTDLLTTSIVELGSPDHALTSSPVPEKSSDQSAKFHPRLPLAPKKTRERSAERNIISL